jgi:hypothetical protein
MLKRNLFWLLLFAGMAFVASGGTFTCVYSNSPTTLVVNHP